MSESECAEQIQALADLTRLRLLNLLTQAREICVCELVDALVMPQYAVSRHLHVLAQAGYLEDRKSGRWVYYRIMPGLKPYQRTLLRAVTDLREESPVFREDEERASRRLSLRRAGVCCVGLMSRIGAALEPAGGKS
jgi:ArsR family transcriptional regulator, arsenate/arsenite/antimonite-responsive transcriptional repressor